MANFSAEDEEVASPLGQNCREFVLPKIRVVNNFPPRMIKDVFGRLHPRFQIPEDIPIRRACKGEKCYSSENEDIGFYEATFIAVLRLPLTEIHRRLADYLGVSICQISYNA